MDYEKLNKIYYSRDKYEGGYWTDIDSGTTVYDTIGFMEQEAKMQEENSVLNNTLTAIGNGAKGSVRGLLGAAKAAIDTNIEIHKKADPNYQPYNDFAPGISESLQSGIDSLKREEIHADSAAGELGYNLIEGAVQLISQVGVTAATGGIGGAVYMSANIAGDQYIDLREQGVDVERAAQAGLMNAPFQAALERVGLNKIFGKIPANSPMRKKLMQVFESAITEGFTEGMQELPQQLTNIWAKDKNATAESMAQKWGENWEQNVKEAGYSALIGGILGGGASGVRVIAGSVGDHIAEKATEAKKEQLVAQAEKVKASGVAPDYAAAYVDANSDGATITVEAKDVAAWMQTAKISNEKAEEMLGVSTDEINQATANGTDIDISRGNFIKAMLSDNSLFEMTKDGMIFDQSGDLSTRGLELKKELREAYAGADELNLELDNELNNVIDSAIGAGMAKTHAENLRVFLASRAMIANPENPAEWLRKNKLRFENAGKAGKNKGGWLQSVGEHAKSANKEQLKAAKEMAANGADEKEIYKKTGWHRGVDGKWRFEIPDNIDGIDIDVWRSQGDEGISLQDLYHNDALFAAYPELKNVNIFKETMEGNTLGYANGNENKIALRKEIVEIRALKNFADFMGRVKSDIESSNVEDKEAIVSLIDKAVANPSAVTDSDIKKISSAISDQFYNDNIKSIDFDSLLFGAEVGDVAPETKAKETFDYIKNYVEDIEQSRNKLKRKLGEVLTHEIQHIIQAQEGFAKGGSQRSVRKNLDEAGVGYNPELKDLDLYWNLAGEQEARRTGTLAQMQSEMRRLKEQESPDTKKIEELQNKIDELVLGTIDKDSAIVYFGDKPVVSYSEEGTVEKGQIAPQDDGSYIVSLFKGADASTVIHETGHYFVDTLVNEAVANPENEALVRDAKALLEYGGMTIEQWQAADIEGKRNAHEILANAFESYIMEGKAPSLGLRAAFRRFANWLSAIYAKIARAPEAKELTPEVREVFDAMFASREEIETIARLDGIFGTLPGTEKLSDTSRAALQDKIMQAKDMAVEILTKEVMRNFNAERRRRKAEYEKEVRPIVEKDVLNEPVIQARQVIADAFAKEHWKTKEDWIEKNGRLYSARIKDRKVILQANPAVIASKYKHVLGNELPNYADQLKYINAEINSRLGDIVEELKAGVKEYKEFGEFWTDNETGEVIDVGDLIGKEELEFDAGMNGNKYRTKHTADTDVNNWYTRFREKEGKRYPTVKEMIEVARDIYAGDDKYGFYNGDIDHLLQGATSEEISAYEAETAARKAELDELFALKEAIEQNKEIVNISKRSALSDDERLGFDMLAESLGYDSGDAMATDILEAPTEGQMIRERVDALVKAKFPDILSERKYAEQKAREAIYNDESGELVALEQVLIEDMINKQVNREAEKKVKKEAAKALKEQADAYAEQFISKSSIADAINVRKWAAAERRAAANAKKAAKKGLFEDAAEYKRQQVALHAIVRKSVQARNRIKVSQRYLRKQLRAKQEAWHHQRHFNQTCALLARMGLKHKGYDPAINQESLAGYVTEMAERYGGFVDVSNFVLDANNDLSNPKELTMEQYMDVIDALKNIRAIANLEAKGIKDGQEATFAAEKEVILKELNKLETRYVPEVGSDKKLSKKDKIKNYFYGLRNADNFYLFMDNWTDGYFTKHWYDVQTRCANKEAEMVMDYQDRAIKAYNKWAPDEATKKAMDEKKSYKELNGISISKNDMIGLLVNLGNEGNAYRLCSTPPLGLEKSGIWVAPDEMLNIEQAAELTKQNLIAFLNKYLTKADIDYAQARIDNCDRFWQEVEALNLRTKGFAPPKVNAVPTIFKLADGQEVVFKGGYFPLKRDSRLGSMPAGQNRIDSTEELGGSGIETMSTTAGSSKNRMKGAKYSVLLEPGSEHKAIMDTIHDICYREAMIGFRKVLNDEEIFAALKMKLGEKNTRLLREQLQTCANPNYNVKVAEAETLLSAAANGLRNVATNAAIMLNLKTALQNTGNVFLYGNSVEGFGYADVLTALQRGLSGANRADIDAICAKSVFLKERMEIPDVTLRDIRNRDDLNPIEKRTLKWGAWLLGYTDMLTAKPVYAQAYTKKIDAGATEQEAIEFADKVIRRTLGSSRKQDVSSLQRGSALFKMITMFQGFFNTQFNQWDRETHIVSNMWKDGNKKEAAMRLSAFMASKYLLACLVNVMISEMSFTAPFEDDDDEYMKISKELLSYPLSMSGPVGQMANVGIQNMLGMSNYGYRLTPAQAVIDKSFTAFRNVGAVSRGEKELTELVEPAIHIGGNYVGIPSSVFNILFNLVDVASGEMDLHATDFLRRRPKAERDLDEK